MGLLRPPRPPNAGCRRARALLLVAATTVAASGVAHAQMCPSGPALGTLLAGDLGPAPPGPHVEIACLEIRDDSGSERAGEIAFAGIPIPRNLALRTPDRLAVVGSGGRRVAAQFDVLSRWGAPRDDVSAPVRWLQVAVPANPPPNGAVRYSLRHYETLVPAADPYAAKLVSTGGTGYEVTTGLAAFGLDAADAALLQSIEIDLDDEVGGARVSVLAGSPAAGPRLIYHGGAGDVTLDGSTAGELVVDANGFEVVENGPVRVVIAQRGHFVDATGETSRCTSGGQDYEALGFTAIFTFARGSRDLRLQVQIRNECSDAQGGDWTDDALTIREASWTFPFALTDQTAWVGGNGALVPSTAGFAGVTVVEQRRGTGTGPAFADWTRRARTRRGGVDLETAEYFEDPLVAISDATLTVAAQMPFLRYREPQALQVEGSALSLRFVSEELRLGEGKGIWNFARVSLEPTALAAAGQTLGAFLEERRAALRAELERGLVSWPGREAVDAARIVPPLGTGALHPGRDGYLAWLETLHDETVRAGGQWERNKSLGSQLWPETGSNDPFGIDVDFPNQSSAGMNYWDPAGVETIEFLASGDPKWLWDFALPGYWTQAFAAYLDTGFTFGGNRNGLAVESGGPGCPPQGTPPFVTPCTPDGTGGGHWHRTGGGSDDYLYAMSLELAYALRPNVALRDRFAQAGQTVVDRYDVAVPELSREAFVNVIGPYRQVIQHFEMLANCAEFVPGARGQACHDELLELVGELARDNLAAGLLCSGAEENGEILGPPAPLPLSCYTPAQFMQNALLYPFLHRFHAMYRHRSEPSIADTVARVRRALVEAPAVLYEHGLEKDPSGLVVFGDWAAALDCQLGNGGTTVQSCVAASDGEGIFQYSHNQPGTVALLLLAHDLDPSLELCGVGRAAFDEPALTGTPDGGGAFAGVGHFVEAGWWKGTAQMMQTVAFGLGVYDRCADDPSADLAVTKTNGVAAVAAGGATEYEIVVSNAGPHDVRDALLFDVLDDQLLEPDTAVFHCAPVGVAGDRTVCPLEGTAADLAAGVAFDLEAGDAVRFVVAVDVAPDAAGTLANTALVQAPAGTTDAVPSNDSATDSDLVGTCAANDIETVSGVATTQVVEACVRIDADALVPGGVELTLQAPVVRLLPQFRVAAGGRLRVIAGLPLE